METVADIIDWDRMLWGDEPRIFLLEIAFRTAVVYIYTLTLLRWLGSRTIGQLSTIEFLLVIALGSAVGDAMFYPDVPLLHALLVVTVVVVANKGLDVIIARSQQAERAIDGIPEEAVRNGVIWIEFMKKGTLSDNELFRQLREKGVQNLGEVGHAYLETDGTMTVFKARDPKPGLPIVPPWEIETPGEVVLDDAASLSEPLACKKCGTITETIAHKCSYCDHCVWVRAPVS